MVDASHVLQAVSVRVADIPLPELPRGYGISLLRAIACLQRADIARLGQDLLDIGNAIKIVLQADRSTFRAATV